MKKLYEFELNRLTQMMPKLKIDCESADAIENALNKMAKNENVSSHWITTQLLERYSDEIFLDGCLDGVSLSIVCFVLGCSLGYAIRKIKRGG